MQHAKIFSSPEKGMTGNELKRLRKGVSLYQSDVATKMSEKGWAYDQRKVCQFEKMRDLKFYLHPNEMQDLLTVLKATSP